MPFSIDRVVPWGRNLSEYQAMFDLSADDLHRRILGCGDGPASFNAKMAEEGHDVISVDPLYAFSAAIIQCRIERSRRGRLRAGGSGTSTSSFSIRIRSGSAPCRRCLAGSTGPGVGEAEADQVGADGKQLRGQPVKDQPATLRAGLAQVGRCSDGLRSGSRFPWRGGC